MLLPFIFVSVYIFFTQCISPGLLVGGAAAGYYDYEAVDGVYTTVTGELCVDWPDYYGTYMTAQQQCGDWSWCATSVNSAGRHATHV